MLKINSAEFFSAGTEIYCPMLIAYERNRLAFPSGHSESLSFILACPESNPAERRRFWTSQNDNLITLIFWGEYCLRIFEFVKGIPGITYYDAAYHVLALEINRTLITADEKYFRKASRKGNIAFIEDWKIS